MAKKKSPQKPEFPAVIETFQKLGSWEFGKWTRDWGEPSCFNGFVHVKKYRITVEEIPEPVEVLAERLRQLWEHSDNHHDRRPLQSAAASLGIELDSKTFGRFRERPASSHH